MGRWITYEVSYGAIFRWKPVRKGRIGVCVRTIGSGVLPPEWSSGRRSLLARRGHRRSRGREEISRACDAPAENGRIRSPYEKPASHEPGPGPRRQEPRRFYSSGLRARMKALANLPATCGRIVSASSPEQARNWRASSASYTRVTSKLMLVNPAAASFAA